MAEELPFSDRLKTYSEWIKEMNDDNLDDVQKVKPKDGDYLVMNI